MRAPRPLAAGWDPARSLSALVTAARPVQWTKNAVVLAPVVFALRATDARSLGRACVALLALCAASSAAYLVNDVGDRDRDGRHPVKRLRPVASGEVPVAVALGTAVCLALAALAASAALGGGVLACVVAFLALQALYSVALKHAPLLDVFAIAGGFVLRVLAGAEAVDVPVSSWLYLCTILLALFLALEKRRAELLLLEDGAPVHRRALGLYTPALVDQLGTITCACTVIAYALYTLAPETIEKFHGDRLKYTIPFVLFGVFRYLLLARSRDVGGEPDLVLVRDRALQLVIAGWLATVAWAIYWRG